MILKIGEELNLEISKVKVTQPIQASPTSQEHPYTEANQQSYTPGFESANAEQSPPLESLEEDDDIPF